MVEVSLRPRARPDDVKPITVDVDDNDQPTESEKLSITDDDGTEIGNVTDTTVSFTKDNSLMQGVRDRLNLSQDMADKTKQSGLSFNIDDLTKIGNASLNFKGGKLSVGYNLGDLGNFYIQGNPKIAQLGFKRKFAEGGFVDNQMDEILNETKDPVSGNTAPVGATTAEVRDDIPIMASPNEFMIDAATRRYYGTPFFENLQAAAKQGFQRIKQGDESFFRDDELEVEQEAQNMQEGGEVEIPDREIPSPTGGGYGDYGGTGAMFTGFEFKSYVHATKPEIEIVFFNGRPLRPIPEGYTLKAGTPVEQQEQKRTSDDTDDDGRGGVEPPKTWRNTDVSNWTEDYYASYANDLTSNKNAGKPSMTERAMLQLVGNIIFPGGGFALEKIVNNDSRKKADQILTNTSKYLKTGKDDDGNVLTAAQLDIYNKARVNANFVKMNLQTKKNIFDFSKADPFASDSPEAASIIQQQQDYIKTLRDKDDDDDNRPPMFGGAPGTFYGGTEQTETDLIQDESLDDDEFFEEFEKGTPSGVGNV